MFNKVTVFVAILALGLGALSTEGSAKGASGPAKIRECGTISEPGSYVVVRNLTAVGDCLVITADNVTIDLGGFTLTGDGTGEGITDNLFPRDGITVRNGTVTNFGHGVLLLGGSGHMIEGVRAVSNAEFGLFIGSDSTVTGNTANANGSQGIRASSGSTVTGNTANENGGIGIGVGLGSTVTGNTAWGQTAGLGIIGDGRNTVSGNTASENATGIAFICPSNLIGNTAVENTTNLSLSGEGCTLFNNLAP